ncbi:arrestin family protein Vdup1 isoform X1 [Haemaphysalis longicornis]
MSRKLQKFLVLLDNESLLYFPGSFLSGKVVVELEEEIPVTGLYFHIVGEGVVRLTDKSKVNTSDRENYIDFRMRLLGENTPKAGSPARVLFLSPGVHSFPFKLGLPLGLPSTFLGKHGWVQYFCKAALKEPGGITHKNQQVFIVMSPIDLNLEPNLLTQPFHCEIEESLGMTCFSSGRLSCRVRLDKGGYVPGESICIFASIENNTRVSIRKTRAVLTETIQYTAKNKVVQAETRELAFLEKGRIEAGVTDQWRNEMLYIPPIPPTNLRGCHLIRIQYDIYFIITPKGPGKEIRLQLPIMMATYPIRNSDGTLQRKKGTHYPTVLPVFRPWLNTDKFKA